MPVFVGLDCGGTSCRVLAISEAREVLFRGQSGPANLLTTPDDVLASSLAKALEGCPEAGVVCGCFAGLLTTDEREKGRVLLSGFFPQARLRLEADYAAAFAACPSGTDICVIAGTGSLVCSRNYGTFDKSGGGGYLIGDPGSGFRFGRAALWEFLNSSEEPSKTLLAAIEHRFGTIEPNEVVKQLYLGRSPAAKIAYFAEVFAEDLREKRAYAVATVAREFLDLARIVADHARRFLPGPHSLQICLAGSIWKQSTQMAEMFENVLATAMEDRGFELSKLRRTPVEGAVELAREVML